jgi:hypothetical protein
VRVESGNEISEDAMALACPVAIFGVPVHLIELAVAGNVDQGSVRGCT